MKDIKAYLVKLLEAKNLQVASNKTGLLDSFCAEESIVDAINLIHKTQKMLTDKWLIRNRIEDVLQKNMVIPNGTVGKPYEAKLDFIKWGLNDIVFTELEGLEELGLRYNNEQEIIHGIPEKAGDVKIFLKFRINGEPEDSILNEKKIALVINPDPRSLWKNLPSDPHDPYWKSDDASTFAPIGNDKHLVVASKRGRSHANVGSFRDDDYAFQYFPNTGWSLVAVADGAGSAKLSRKGSELACKAIVDYFGHTFTLANSEEFDALLYHYLLGTGEDTIRKLNLFVYQHLSQAALFAHNRLATFSNEIQCELKDLHSTLIFTLFKKCEEKYAFLSFGVGDCPIALLNSEMSEITMMNWLDVGEFGGGTRFITMPEIFSSDKFSTRFKFKLVDDFAYLMLLTDGIYDPKFVVEANLEKIENWREFIKDLEGNNPGEASVDLSASNPAVDAQLSKWMDFWSIGNHDDRTLAIVF